MPNDNQPSEIGIYMPSPEELAIERQEVIDSALSKLAALGLTEEEAKAIVGV